MLHYLMVAAAVAGHADAIKSYQGRRKAPDRGQPYPPLPEPTQKGCDNDGNQEPRANGLVNELPSKAPREAGRKEVFAIERLKY